MIDEAKRRVQRDILELKESLDTALVEAGGTPLAVAKLRGMSALDLLSILSGNKICFKFTK